MRADYDGHRTFDDFAVVEATAGIRAEEPDL